jgi:hypothetical protein
MTLESGGRAGVVVGEGGRGWDGGDGVGWGRGRAGWGGVGVGQGACRGDGGGVGGGGGCTLGWGQAGIVKGT